MNEEFRAFVETLLELIWSVLRSEQFTAYGRKLLDEFGAWMRVGYNR